MHKRGWFTSLAFCDTVKKMEAMLDLKDIIDKLSSSLKNTCKEALDQTQKTVDQAKYRSDILTLKNELTETLSKT